MIKGKEILAVSEASEIRLNEVKVRINDKMVKKLLAVIARGGIERSHSKAVEWASKIFFVQNVGDKRRYVDSHEASKLISGSM